MRGLVVCTLLVVSLVAVRRAGADDELSVEEVARRVRGSVVTIRHTGRSERDQGLGTGFVVAADGLVATNLHVIGEARPVSVELSDGSRHDVIAVHAVDRAADLAVVRIARQGLAPLAFGDPKSLADGQEVVAVGNPHGLQRSVVAGRVSGTREIDGRKMIQLAIPIEPGNSGGPLLDLEGRVHGVVTMKSLVTPFLGFAVGVDQLAPLLENPNPVTMDRWLTIGAIDPREWTVVGGARWRQRAGRISVEGAGSGFGGRLLGLSLLRGLRLLLLLLGLLESLVVSRLALFAGARVTGDTGQREHVVAIQVEVDLAGPTAAGVQDVRRARSGHHALRKRQEAADLASHGGGLPRLPDRRNGVGVGLTLVLVDRAGGGGSEKHCRGAHAARQHGGAGTADEMTDHYS